MRVGIPKEAAPGERRVALVPETIGRLGEGVEVVIEQGAGVEAGFTDAAYTDAGATIGDPWACDVVVKVAAPSATEAARLRDGQVLVAFLAPLTDADGVARLAAAGVYGLALESIPRITRAQPMDALSSQATVSRVQGGARRRRPAAAFPADADDGGRDDPSGEGARARRGRRRACRRSRRRAGSARS